VVCAALVIPAPAVRQHHFENQSSRSCRYHRRPLTRGTIKRSWYCWHHSRCTCAEQFCRSAFRASVLANHGQPPPRVVRDHTNLWPRPNTTAGPPPARIAFGSTATPGCARRAVHPRLDAAPPRRQCSGLVFAFVARIARRLRCKRQAAQCLSPAAMYWSSDCLYAALSGASASALRSVSTAFWNCPACE
jgi:hypothetical protein